MLRLAKNIFCHSKNIPRSLNIHCLFFTNSIKQTTKKHLHSKHESIIYFPYIPPLHHHSPIHNGHQLLRGKLLLDQIQDTNFLAEDGAQDTLSLLEGCEQVLVVVRHGKDGDQQSFPADVPDHIQDVHAEYYALNDVGHATAMFLRDHLDPFLESNNYCAVTSQAMEWEHKQPPHKTLSPWAAKHGDVKYKFVANDDQNDDGFP